MHPIKFSIVISILICFSILSFIGMREEKKASRYFVSFHDTTGPQIFFSPLHFHASACVSIYLQNDFNGSNKNRLTHNVQCLRPCFFHENDRIFSFCFIIYLFILNGEPFQSAMRFAVILS